MASKRPFGEYLPGAAAPAEKRPKCEEDAYLYVTRDGFDALCAKLAPLVGAPTLFSSVANLLCHPPMLCNNWRRTIVVCNESERALAVCKGASVGHKQLIDLAKRDVCYGVVVADGFAMVHDLHGPGAQSDKSGRLFDFLGATMRPLPSVSQAKQRRPIRYALLDPGTRRAVCSYATQALIEEWVRRAPIKKGHAAVPCVVCGTVVDATSLLRRFRQPLGVNANAHRSQRLCVVCNGVPGYKGGARARVVHDLSSGLTL